MSEHFAQRLESIQARLAAALKRASRVGGVEIIAVSKTHPAEAIREAYSAGLRHFGESKVQEARAKMGEDGLPGVWHFIGHLQSNKVREAVHYFSHIDSVDSMDLAREIDRRAGEAGRRISVLLQVNVAGEGRKYGFPVGEARAAAEAVNELAHVELRGLMLIAPYSEDPEKARPVFAGLRKCREAIESATGLQLPELSMGMSHDFEVAVEEGATQIRVGTDLFGQRRAANLRAGAAAELD